MLTHPWQSKLALAYSKAQGNDFLGFKAACAQIASQYGDNVSALLDVGALLLNFGCVSDATKCFERCDELSPSDLRAKINLANCARDSGQHTLANDLYLALQEQHPNNVTVRRNVLVTQQYNPEISDEERINLAKSWGQWAIAMAGG